MATHLHDSYYPSRGEEAEMTCQEALKLLTPYLGGKLAQEQAIEVRSHFRSCRECPRVRNYGGGIYVLEERRPARRHHHQEPAKQPA